MPIFFDAHARVMTTGTVIFRGESRDMKLSAICHQPTRPARSTHILMTVIVLMINLIRSRFSPQLESCR
jgi:hypothetical protein